MYILMIKKEVNTLSYLGYSFAAQQLSISILHSKSLLVSIRLVHARALGLVIAPLTIINVSIGKVVLAMTTRLATTVLTLVLFAHLRIVNSASTVRFPITISYNKIHL